MKTNREFMRISQKYLMTPRKWYELWLPGFKKHETRGVGKWEKVWLRELGESKRRNRWIVKIRHMLRST